MTYATHRTNGVVGTKLPLAYQLTPKLYKSVTVAQKVIPGLAVGDLVHVVGRAQAEIPLATQPPIDRAMLASYLKVTKTGSNSSLEGLVLDRPMGFNFDRLDHYGLQNVAGSFVAGVDNTMTGTVTVMLVMYAANLSQVATDPRSLSVKYVELRADVHKP